MKARNEVCFLFIFYDLVKPQPKSSHPLSKPINYPLDGGMTHSFLISSLSAAETS